MKLLAIPTLALLVLTSGQAHADTCNMLRAKIDAQSVKVQRHAELVGILGDQLYKAGDAEDINAIRTYTELSKRQLRISIAGVKYGIRLVDQMSAAGGCGRSKARLAHTRSLGVKSLAAYNKALRSVNAIPVN